MFKSEIVTDKYGNLQTNFILTQGDTATIKSRPTKNKELINFDLVEKCMFKLSDSDYTEILAKEFIRGEDRYSVTLETEETTLLPVDKLIYEVEYTFTDGTVNTPNKGVFEVTDQIVKR